MAQALDDLVVALHAHEAAIAVLGLGYVGRPLAACLAQHFQVLGFDAEAARARPGVLGPTIEVSADPVILARARVFIVCVPTPVTATKQPDLGPLLAASRTVAAALRPGCVVIYESTVYPGCTEEDCIPELERVSGLRAGLDFGVGYSPERINPGDERHSIDRVVKIVSGLDAPSQRVVEAIYGRAITAGIHCAPSIAVAEAAKVVENTQRDLNIALVNELALICHRLGLDTRDVLAAAGTKWNFLPFEPGLVGGHCIDVDPQYLTHRAERAGYHPQVILAGRRINSRLGAWIAQETVRLLLQSGKNPKGARVLVLGVTFKEDWPDCRNSRVVDLIEELRRWHCEPIVCDPVADPAEVLATYGIVLTPMSPLPAAEACVLAVRHAAVRSVTIAEFASALPAGAPLIDIKGILDRAEVAAAGLLLWRL